MCINKPSADADKLESTQPWMNVRIISRTLRRISYLGTSLTLLRQNHESQWFLCFCCFLPCWEVLIPVVHRSALAISKRFDHLFIQPQLFPLLCKGKLESRVQLTLEYMLCPSICTLRHILFTLVNTKCSSRRRGLLNDF